MALTFKLELSAQDCRSRVSAPRLLALARAAADFKNGEQATTYGAEELELLVKQEFPQIGA